MSPQLRGAGWENEYSGFVLFFSPFIFERGKEGPLLTQTYKGRKFINIGILAWSLQSPGIICSNRQVLELEAGESGAEFSVALSLTSSWTLVQPYLSGRFRQVARKDRGKVGQLPPSWLFRRQNDTRYLDFSYPLLHPSIIPFPQKTSTVL